ncbi:MAG: septal ring lytic transglycosylase RlpA family protein [Deltaproteobacteria bacterium]|nr:septal ring lytic transglycosylase RlpA family protein [Deltaproteobacteria bacterium]
MDRGMLAFQRVFLAVIMTFAGLSGCSWRPDVRPAGPGVRRIVLPEEPPGEVPSYVVHGVRYYPLPDADGFVQTGQASWYGVPFHGRTTSNGETYDMRAHTAAHKTLPFGTYVSVKNLVNGRSTVVRINDRGPFVKGRIIDLSYASGKEIGLVGPGVATVRVTALAPQVAVRGRAGAGTRPVVETRDLKAGAFTVQVGAFLDRGNALDLVKRLGVLFDYVKITEFVDERDRTLHRVRVTRSGSLDEAGKMEKRLKEMGFEGSFVVRI